MMPTQQAPPMRIGFPPVRISLTILLLRPMAAIAMMMKNLLSSLSGVNTDAETPALIATVVMTEAAMKYRIKNGNAFLKLKPFA